MTLAVAVDNNHHQSGQKKKNSDSTELADIFNRYADDYIATHKLSPKQHKVIFNIRNCQKGEFGYHIDICNRCGYMEKGYNSCHDRHCPRCQGGKRRQWIQARINELLPVPYFHIVFTLPHFLFRSMSSNMSLFYAAFCLSPTSFFTGFPGLRYTVPTGVQSRVSFDQRSGCFALAAS